MADKVALLLVGCKVEIARQPSILLVLVIVAVAVGIEHRGVELPMVIETMVQNELIVDLQVVIGLVIVVVYMGAIGQDEWAVRGCILTRIVIPTAIERHILARHAIVGKIGLCRATKRQQLNLGLVAIVAHLRHIALKVG